MIIFNHRKYLVFIYLLLSSSLIIGCSYLLEATHTKPITTHQTEKRTLGSLVEDQSIEAKILANLRKSDPKFTQNMNVVSYNGVVLLAGRLSSQAMIDKAIQIASQVNHVRQVQSELTVGANSTIANYWYDVWLTTKLKARMLFTKEFPAHKIKVVSERGIIYLMGLVTEQEANLAIQAARQIQGSYKIVTLFEYVNKENSNAKQPNTQTVRGY